MTKGKLEKTIVDPYLPNKIVPLSIFGTFCTKQIMIFQQLSLNMNYLTNGWRKNTRVDMRN
jgi:hypothetical protein